MSIPYPDPISRENAERMVEQQIAWGWTYPTQGPEQREDAILRTQRKARMSLWLKQLGVRPDPERRREYHQARMRQEAAKRKAAEGEPEA